jgi:hypothetical protein
MTAHPKSIVAQSYITTGMPQALAAAMADHMQDCTDCGDLGVTLFMKTSRRWECPDESVGFHGGYDVTATMIGAQIGELVLSRADAAAALGPLVAWVERDASERLTENADYDAPMAPSRMEE